MLLQPILFSNRVPTSSSSKFFFKSILLLLIPILSSILVACSQQNSLPTDPSSSEVVSKCEHDFSFCLTADIHEYTGDYPTYFRGVCESIAQCGYGSFMITLGDMTPPAYVYKMVTSYLGQSYLWYPVVGNHELLDSAQMEWLRNFNKRGNSLPNIVNSGPAGGEETTYSFDFQQAHFVILNVYFDGTNDRGSDGDISDNLYNWLVADLTQTKQPLKFVFGHEPAYPQPDMETGRTKHSTDSLNFYPANRDRFWELLKEQGVLAYFCGHTHSYSHMQIEGVW